MQSLPIMFRVHEGEVTAIFPTLPHNSRLSTDVTVYVHVGQHSSASWEWIAQTREATETEYVPLLRELVQIYHDCTLLVITASPSRSRRHECPVG